MILSNIKAINRWVVRRERKAQPVCVAASIVVVVVAAAAVTFIHDQLHILFFFLLTSQTTHNKKEGIEYAKGRRQCQSLEGK